MEIVVLGMHRSGTSLVAQILTHLGVNMGEEMLGADEHNPWGYWEDVSFIRANHVLLKLAQGTWHEPPPRKELKAVMERNMPTIAPAVLDPRRGQPRWGWKDPRTVLTIGGWEPYLEDPLYVVVRRKFRMIAHSLLRRSRSVADTWRERIVRGEYVPKAHAEALALAERTFEDWHNLVLEYDNRLRAFLATVERGRTITLHYENLIGEQEAAIEELRMLALMLGWKRGTIAAQACIHRKEKT